MPRENEDISKSIISVLGGYKTISIHLLQDNLLTNVGPSTWLQPYLEVDGHQNYHLLADHKRLGLTGELQVAN